MLPSRPNDPGLALLPPASAHRKIEISQQLRLERSGQSFEALGALQLDDKELSLAVLGPLGNRMLSLRWDGKNLAEERDPTLPADLPLKAVLRDLQYALFPADAIRDILPGGWELTEESLAGGRHRRNIRHNGLSVIIIVYEGEDPYLSALTLTHKTFNYSITVTPVLDEE